jgi:hypothetical protein
MRADVAGNARPVTRPMRALISWIATISGKQNSITQHIA